MYHPMPDAPTQTILLVENSQTTLEVLGMVLREKGYVVLEAASPEEAENVSDTYPGDIALLISHVSLHFTMGEELAARLQSTRPKMKVLFLSGYPRAELIRKGWLRADAAFLQQPFTHKGLEEEVARLVSEQASAAALVSE